MLTIRPDSSSQKGNCSTFCGSLHSWRSCALLGKMRDYCQKKGHFASDFAKGKIFKIWNFTIWDNGALQIFPQSVQVQVRWG